MALDFQVLSIGDLDEVYTFADDRLKKQIPDENERTFHSWHAKWRKEALEHYLRLGWSFIARDNGRVVGFFLGQPLIFFRGQTQTLWLECMQARDNEVAEALFEVAVKVAREKHLQRVLIADADAHRSALDKWKPVRLDEDIAEIKSSKG